MSRLVGLAGAACGVVGGHVRRGAARRGPFHAQFAEAGLARLGELGESEWPPDAVIDRLRTTIQGRVGSTRARLDESPGAGQVTLTGTGSAP